MTIRERTFDFRLRRLKALTAQQHGTGDDLQGKMEWMSVVWAATSPESGLFHPVERSSEVKDLSNRFNELRSRGQGYLEVRSPNREFPMLSLAFRDDHAVVHLMSSTERMSLLAGDGTVPSHAEVEVPIMDDLAVFKGDFILDIDLAWDLLHSFTQTQAAGPLGEWSEL
ncbi:hypothetical protein ACIOTI_32135 [Streptomyces sp. NPDC087843]|uniref:hypothetical protein n=1 Tax=Streptomyces sp. NPDC087843 TaxID=3365804 RepID=UPI003810BF23